jgi:hypothetical protein
MYLIGLIGMFHVHLFFWLDDEQCVPQHKSNEKLQRKIGGTISDYVDASGQGFSIEIVWAMIVLIMINNS